VQEQPDIRLGLRYRCGLAKEVKVGWQQKGCVGVGSQAGTQFFGLDVSQSLSESVKAKVDFFSLVLPFFFRISHFGQKLPRFGNSLAIYRIVPVGFGVRFTYQDRGRSFARIAHAVQAAEALT
jgi:hypothetical protein